MDIVFVAHFAGSPRHGMVYGHYYLAREWVRLGHRVTIVAASHAHTRHQQPESHERITEEYIDGIRYLWVRSPIYSPSDRFGRVKNILGFVGQTYFRSLPIDKADLVICSSHYPFAIHPAQRLSRRLNAKLVFEVRDLWPLTLMELGGASSRHPFIRAMQWSEDFAYRCAERVVSVLVDARKYMIEHGMDPGKFLYVPNGVDLDAQARPELLPEEHRLTLDRLSSEGRFLVGYAGRVGLANALHSLIEAVAKSDQPDVHAVILGEGSHIAELRLQAENLGIVDQVTFLEPVNKSQVFDFLAYMDAVYIGLQSQPLFRFGVSPTKLNDYMLAAKPIIYAIDAPGDVVAESGAGISCRAEDSEDIRNAILKLRTLSPQERKMMGQKGYQWLVANRSYKVLAKRFLAGVCTVEGVVDGDGACSMECRR